MSIQDLMVLRGRVASDVVFHQSEGPDGRSFARFRMAVPRPRRRDDGQWEEGEPQWYTVKAWGILASHVNLSLRRGAPIIVVGRPSAQGWIAKTGEIRTDLAIHAVSIGHDLVFGVTTFARLRPQTPAAQVDGDLVEDDTAQGVEPGVEGSGVEGSGVSTDIEPGREGIAESEGDTVDTDEDEFEEEVAVAA